LPEQLPLQQLVGSEEQMSQFAMQFGGGGAAVGDGGAEVGDGGAEVGVPGAEVGDGPVSESFSPEITPVLARCSVDDFSLHPVGHCPLLDGTKVNAWHESFWLHSLQHSASLATLASTARSEPVNSTSTRNSEQGGVGGTGVGGEGVGGSVGGGGSVGAAGVGAAVGPPGRMRMSWQLLKCSGA
jgi:hypothetical protein